MEKEFVDHPRSSLREKIPVRPLKPVPLEDVPMWKTLAYDTKYPFTDYSKKYASLTTEELGKSLYQTFPSKEFDLSQSPVPFVDASYNSLHDPHLRGYFQSLSRYKALMEKGLVTEDGKVKALLQEYNQYRMYLYHLWGLQVNQLVQTQMKTERSCFESMLRALDSEDALFREVAERYDEINANEILEEVATKLFQNNIIIGEHGFSPFIRSVIQWKIFQEKLKKDFKSNYPVVQEWLSEQNKHYKRLMDKKMNDRRDNDAKIRKRWEKLCETSQARLEKELMVKDAVKKRRRNLAQQRYNKVKSLWAKDEQDILLRRNASKTLEDFLAPNVVDSEKWKKFLSQAAVPPHKDWIIEPVTKNQIERNLSLLRSESEFSEDTFLSLSASSLTEERRLDASSEISKASDDDALIRSSVVDLQTDDGSETSKISESKAYSEVPRDKRKLDILEQDKSSMQTGKSSELLPKKKLITEEDQDPCILPGSVKGIPHKRTRSKGSVASSDTVTGILEKRTSEEGYNLLKIKPDASESEQDETNVLEEMISEGESLLERTSPLASEDGVKAKNGVWRKASAESRPRDRSGKTKITSGIADKSREKLIIEKDEDPCVLQGSVKGIPHKRTSDEGSLVSSDSATNVLERRTSEERYDSIKAKLESNESKQVKTTASGEMISKDEILPKGTSRLTSEDGVKRKSGVWKKIDAEFKSIDRSKRTKSIRGITDESRKKLITEKDQDPCILSGSAEDIAHKRRSEEGSLTSSDSVADALDKRTGKKGYDSLKIKSETNKSKQKKISVSDEKTSEDETSLKSTSLSTADGKVKAKNNVWRKVDYQSKSLDRSKRTKIMRVITDKSRKKLITEKDQDPCILSGSAEDIPYKRRSDESSLVSSDSVADIFDKRTSEERHDLLKIKPITSKSKQMKPTVSGERIPESEILRKGTSHSTSVDEVTAENEVLKKMDAGSKSLDRSKRTKMTRGVTDKSREKLITEKDQDSCILSGSAEDIPYKRTSDEGSLVSSDSVTDMFDKRTSEEGHDLLKIKPVTRKSKQMKPTVSGEMIPESEILRKDTSHSTSEDEVTAENEVLKKMDAGSKSLDRSKRTKITRGITDKSSEKLITEKDQDPCILSGSAEDIPYKRTSDEGSLVSSDSVTDMFDKRTSEEGHDLLKIKPVTSKSKQMKPTVSGERIPESEILRKDTSHSISVDEVTAENEVLKKMDAGSKSLDRSKRTKITRGITDMSREKDQDPHNLSDSVEDIPYKSRNDESSLVSPDSATEILGKHEKGHDSLRIKPEAKSKQVKTIVSGEMISGDEILLKGTNRLSLEDRVKARNAAWKKVDADSKSHDRSKRTKISGIADKSRKKSVIEKDQDPYNLSDSVKDIPYKSTCDEGSLALPDSVTEILDKRIGEEGHDSPKIKPETNKSKQMKISVSDNMISEDKILLKSISRSTSENEIKAKDDWRKLAEESKSHDRIKKSENARETSHKLLPVKEAKQSPSEMDHQSLLTKYLHDLSKQHDMKEPKLDTYKCVTQTESADISSTLDEPKTHEKTSKTVEDSPSYLREILGAYGYKEYSDIWKALENSLNAKKMKFLESHGLTYEKVKEHTNERIWKEFNESKILPLPSSPSISIQHPTVATSILKEENLKIYKTDSSGSEDESKEGILRRSFGKKRESRQLDDTFIHDYRFMALREIGKTKSELPTKQDHSEEKWRSNLDTKENLSGHTKSQVYRYRKDKLDLEIFDFFRSGKRSYFRNFSKRENQSRTRFEDSISYKKTPSEIPSYKKTVGYPESICSDMKSTRMKDYRSMLLPDPIVSKLNKNEDFSFPCPRPIKSKSAFSEDDKIMEQNIFNKVSLDAQQETESDGETESESAIANLLQQDSSESEEEHVETVDKMAFANEKKYSKVDEKDISTLVEDIISEVQVLKVKAKKAALKRDEKAINDDKLSFELKSHIKTDYDVKDKVVIQEAEESSVGKEFKEVESDELKETSGRKQITVTPDVIQNSVTKYVDGIVLKSDAKQENFEKEIDSFTRFEEDDSKGYLTETEVKGIDISSKHADLTNKKYVSPLISEIDEMTEVGVINGKQVALDKDTVISSEIVKADSSHVPKKYFESEDAINFEAHMDRSSLQQDKQLKEDETLSNQTEELDEIDVTNGIRKSIRQTPPSKKPKDETCSDIHFSETDSNYDDDVQATLAKFLHELVQKVTEKIQASTTDIARVTVDKQSTEEILKHRDDTVDKEAMRSGKDLLLPTDENKVQVESEITQEKKDTFKNTQGALPTELNFLYSTVSHFDPFPKTDSCDDAEEMESHERAFEYLRNADDSSLSKEELPTDEQTEVDKQFASYDSSNEISKRKIKKIYPMPEMIEEKDLILPSDVKVVDASEESVHLANFQPTKEICYDSEKSYYAKKEDTKTKYDLAITATIQDGSIAKVMEDENAAKEEGILLNINVEKVNLSVEPSMLPDSVSTSSDRVHENHEEYYKIRADAALQCQSKLKDEPSMKSAYFELPRSSSIADSVTNFESSKEIRHHEYTCADNEFLRLKSHLTPPQSLKDIVIKNLKYSLSYDGGKDATSERFSDKSDLLKDENLPEMRTSDDIISAVKLDPQNISEAKAHKIDLEHVILSPLPTKYCFLSESKSPTRHLTVHASDSSTLTVTTEKSKPDIKSALRKTQIIRHNKNISMDLKGPFPQGKNDLEIDFSKINSVSINFKFPESLISTNLNEESVKIFLTEWISSVMQGFVKCTHFNAPVEPSLDVPEADSLNAHAFQDKEVGSILNTKLKTAEERILQSDEDIEQYMSESDALQNDEDNEEYMLESDAFESDSDISESNGPVSNQDEKLKVYSLLTTDPSNAQSSIIPTQELPVSSTLNNQGPSFNVENTKQDKPDASFRQKSFIKKMKNPFAKRKNKRSERTSAEKADITIIEDIKSFSGCPIRESEYNDQANAQLSHATYIHENEEQQKKIITSRSRSKFDPEEHQEKRSGTGKYRSRFKDPWKYVSIISIADERAQCLEDHFKTNEIRSKFTNVGEVVITDEVEHEDAIIENEVLKLDEE